MTAYTDFVRQHIGRLQGDQKEKMRQVAVLWKQHKAQGAGMATAKLAGGGKRAHAYEIAETAAAEVKPARKRIGAQLAGGGVPLADLLLPANQMRGAGFSDFLMLPKDGYDGAFSGLKYFAHGLVAPAIIAGKVAVKGASALSPLFD